MPKNAKILILSHISELVGGAERSILEVMEIWENIHGVTPEFILREPVGTLGPELDRRGWKYNSLPYTFWSESEPPVTSEQKHKAASQNTQAILKIEEIIKATKPDIVLTNSIVCPWAAIAAHYQRIPHVWFVREYGDLDHGRVFDMDREKTFQDVDFLSQLVITNSKALAEHVSQYIPKEKVTTLYHPFDIEKMIANSKARVENPFKFNGSLKLVLPAGSITASKGFQEAITAVGELNLKGYVVELCVIGNMHEEEFIKKLKKIIKEYGIEDKIHFIGFKKNLMPYVAFADVGIMSSRMEAFGRVTFEYMVLSKPVVGVNAGATPEMVKDGHNGHLYKYRDTKSMVNAIMHYAKDRKLIAKHGHNSLTRAKEMMRSAHNVDALYTRFEKVTKTDTSQLPPILNFSHQWLTYPKLADEYLEDEGVLSIRRLVKKNIKARIRYIIQKLKAYYRRLFR